MKPLRAIPMIVLCLATLALTLAASAPEAIDVHGTARVAGRPASNAVVWIDAPHAPQSTDHRKVILDQRNLDFYPHVLAVRVGTTVDFPNDDRVFHNVFSFRDGKIFDLGMYPVGTLKHVTFDQPGLSRIFCNIHPNMAAYVMAVDSPNFAVSDESGAFTIGAVSARDAARYHACRAGAADRSGTLTPGTPTNVATLSVEWP